MRYRITYSRGTEQIDLDITADATATVRDLAGTLRQRDPRKSADGSDDATLSLSTGSATVTLQPDQQLAESPLRSGMRVSAVRGVSGAGRDSAAKAVLKIVRGPDAGKQFPLSAGAHTLGRNATVDIRLSDPLVSREHARIVVGSTIEILDTNSANGVIIDGAPVGRATLRSGDTVLLGDSHIAVERAPAADSTTQTHITDEAFMRPPRLRPGFPPEEHPAPEIPRPPAQQRFPAIALLTPVFLGAAIYAMTRSPVSLVFVAMTPIMMLGSWLENRWSVKRQLEMDRAEFSRQLQALGTLVRQRQEEERTVRRAENPSAETVAKAIRFRDPLLWTRDPAHDEFLQLRLGLATLPSRVTIATGMVAQPDGDMRRELESLRDALTALDAVPVVANLRTCGALGISGRSVYRDPVAASMVIQAAGLHSPADLSIAACMGTRSSGNWDWLKWLPHTSSSYLPVDCEVLANSLTSGTDLISALEDLIATRGKPVPSSQSEVAHPAVLLIVESDCTVDEARLVWLAERGPEVGVHVLWCAPRTELLPAACRAFVEATGGSSGSAGFVDDGVSVSPLELDQLPMPTAAEVARQLAPVSDAGAREQDETNLPRSISYLVLAGPPLAEDASAVMDRWRETNSVNSLQDGRRQRRAGTLRALIGQSGTEPVAIDLRSQGPHALVGGTTGSGKSELLQTWVLSLAAAYSPDRVTFLLVDYKGGSAFGECVSLPHCVGLVTDLSPHLVRRALVSLEAELKYRERVLDRAKVKDLESMERLGVADTPPSLVIVVDEFAALATDVPEFVDGVVNIAQRGRSLGLHLILATQRPAGVIKDNLRANTNLRLALRMADEADSLDVLGTPDAAHFDPDAPGRAAIRNGPDRVTAFQSGYVGGFTDPVGDTAEIRIMELAFGTGREWEEPESATDRRSDMGSQTDLQRLVGTVNSAAAALGLTEPRKPWLAELPDAVEQAGPLLQGSREGYLPFALGDLPERQAQPVVEFHPDTDGNLAIVGTGGTGKSTVLRTLAVAAAHDPSGPVHVYCLDYGSRGLHMLQTLPNVGTVVSADDTERTHRLLREARAAVDERSARFARAQAATLTEYRARTGEKAEPRVLILVDGLAAFRQAHENAQPGNAYDLLASIAADGRPVGVHVVVTADRWGVVPSALASLMPRRLVLRTADDNDLAMLAVPRDLFSLQSPPGRGFIDGHEVQVAIIGGEPSVAVQAQAIEHLAAELSEASPFPPAPPVRRLPEDVSLGSLPPSVGGAASFALEDSSLDPVGLPDAGTFVVTGPPGSGRTTALQAIIAAVRRARPACHLALFSPGRSSLEPMAPWDQSCTDIDRLAGVVGEVTAVVKDAPGGNWLVVIEGIGDLVNSSADLALQDLVKAARRSGQLVVAEGDTQAMSASWPLQQALRFSRRGLALQPDQGDGELVFRTPFPRIRRADFPRGRGLLVSDGRVQRVQVARV